MRRRLERELLFALEVMEEAALGQAGGTADVVDRGRRITLRRIACTAASSSFAFDS